MMIAFPHLPGQGGPASFQRRFEQAIKERGHAVSYAINDKENDAILIVGGSKKLLSLAFARWQGIPVFHRLDGIGWLHRKKAARRGIKTFFYGELSNLLINVLHSFVANRVIYQSNFVKDWWKKSGWRIPKNPTIIPNGVCLKKFKPEPSKGAIRLLCLEGNIDYSPYAAKLLNLLYERLKNDIELVVYGDFFFPDQRKLLNPKIDYRGRVGADQLVSAYQNSIFLSLDVNAACPNTVIEALACGTPVVGYDTGALRELVPTEAGIVVPYGGNPWNLEFPDVDALVSAILKIQSKWEEYSRGARNVAEQRYGIEQMVDRYLAAIIEFVDSKKNKS